MKKPIRKRVLKAFLCILTVIISLVLLINVPIITLGHNTSINKYNSWMSDTLDDDQLVVDVAMLGAHDAFSNEINLLSELDPYNTDGIMHGLTGILVKGFIMRQSVTQISDAETLLQSGVRYLDVRLSYYEETWYTKHNYLSGDFQPIAQQITDFLDENSGEFLVLDFQHISGIDYSKTEDYNLFIQMLDSYGLTEYAYEVSDLSTLTYGEITNDGTESKAIIITKFEDSNQKILKYENSIRSNWADSDDFDYVMEFLIEESNSIEENTEYDKFRVMQAVTTMKMSGPGIVNALTNWSLINRAKKFNAYLIENDQFTSMLNELPIIMVDYANTNSKDFNDNIMEIIMDFN
jgi:hypothetical protein